MDSRSISVNPVVGSKSARVPPDVKEALATENPSREGRCGDLMNDVRARVFFAVETDRVRAKIYGPVDPIIRKYNFKAVYSLTGEIFSGHAKSIPEMFLTVFK